MTFLRYKVDKKIKKKKKLKTFLLKCAIKTRLNKEKNVNPL